MSPRDTLLVSVRPLGLFLPFVTLLMAGCAWLIPVDDLSSQADGGAVASVTREGKSGVVCGTQTCAIGSSSVCCVSADGQRACANERCGSGEITLVYCDDPADCAREPGSTCCFDVTDRITRRVRCMDSCSGPNMRELCVPGAEGACPAGKTCAEDPALVGQTVCR